MSRPFTRSGHWSQTTAGIFRPAVRLRACHMKKREEQNGCSRKVGTRFYHDLNPLLTLYSSNINNQQLLF